MPTLSARGSRARSTLRKGAVASRAGPLSLYVVALIAVLLLLPTVLRPPRLPPNTSAELSPDAPPDENQTAIVSSFNRATSGIGIEGTGTGQSEAPGGVLTAPAPPPAVEAPRACPGGFGNPPRQVEWVYAAPCATAFTGDNGGATYTGVSADEVRFGFIHCTSSYRATYDGPVPDKPPEGEDEDDADRTLRVFQQYFNKYFMFYGRRLQLYSVSVPYEADPSQLCSYTRYRAGMIKMAEEYQVFGATSGFASSTDEGIRRKLVVEGMGSSEFYQKNFPYVFSHELDGRKLEDANGEFLCKQLVGRPTAYTDDPQLLGQPRKLGALTWVGDNHGWTENDLNRILQRHCDHSYADVIELNPYDASRNSAFNTAMTRFKAQGITTVAIYMDYLFAGRLQNEATAIQYYPEWLVCGCYQNDYNQRARTYYDPAHARHTFGITGGEVPRPTPEKDGYRAYKLIDPDGEPDMEIVEGLILPLLHVANGIQMAGPNLTPTTFMQGLMKVPARVAEPGWSMGGGYRPGDMTWRDHVSFVWWSPTATAPDEPDSPGAFQHVWNGRKFRIGELPTEPVPFFRDGVAGWSRDG